MDEMDVAVLDRPKGVNVVPKPLPLEEDAPELRGASLRRALGLVTLAWVFGSVWQTATSGAPLTLFAASLHASQFQFGLLSALPFIASLVSMPASLWTERTGLRKPIFLWGTYPNRLLWVPIALLPMYIVSRLGSAGYALAMSLFLILMFMMHSSGAVGSPAWTSWMADVVPERSRGKYFSRRRQWGIASAIPAALFAGWLLDRLNHTSDGTNPLVVMKWCAILFMCSAVFGFLDIHLFRWVPDHTQPAPKRVSLSHIFAGPMRDRQFLWFAGFVGTLTFAVSFMGQFVTLYMLEKLHSTSTQVQFMLLVAPMIAQLLVLPIWGRAADRMGKKPVLAIASLGLVPVGFGWCFCSRELLWLGYLLSALGAALWVGVEVANLNLVLEFSGTGEESDGSGSNYVAVNSVIINIAGCLGGLSAGVIAQALHNWNWNPHIPGLHEIGCYEILFALSGVLRLLAAVVFLPMIHEPAARPTRETLRFMTANIYNNLFNTILLPLRSVRVRKRESYVQAEAPRKKAA
jgi:MFS family permease